MDTNTVLQFLALVFLVLAMFKVSEPQRLSFGWGGLALWILTNNTWFINTVLK